MEKRPINVESLELAAYDTNLKLLADVTDLQYSMYIRKRYIPTHRWKVSRGGVYLACNLSVQFGLLDRQRATWVLLILRPRILSYVSLYQSYH